MIRNYFKTAWRNLWHHKGASWLNIGGLAVAMAAAILILMWVQNERTYDRYHADADRIHLLTVYDSTRIDLGYRDHSPYPAVSAIRQSIPGTERIASARYSLYNTAVFEVNEKKFYEKNALYVDSNWTKIFHYEVLEGSIATFENTPYSLLITRSKARQYFGNLPALAQTIYIDSIPHQVAGVIADIPANSSLQQDILISEEILFQGENRADKEEWGRLSQLLFIKLIPGVHNEQMESGITAIFKENQPWAIGSSRINKLIALPDLHFMEGLNSRVIPKGNPQNIKIFSLLAGLLLITAAINFVNLSVARVGVRLKEIGIRKIVGAAKRQLFFQVLTETALSVLLALGLAILISLLALPYFNVFTERQFTLDPGNGMIWTLLGGIFVVVLLLTGVYPALLLTRLKPIGLLRNQGWSGMSRLGLRRVLVAAQLTLAVFMIIGVLVINRQFAFIQQQVAGYQKEQVFKVMPPFPKESFGPGSAADQRYENSLQVFKNELLARSSFMAVSKTNGVSMLDDKNYSRSADYRWGDQPVREDARNMATLWVDGDYIKISGLKLKSGRWFEPSNVSDKNNIVINETAVREYGLQEPVVGTTYSGDISKGTIIGVVEDFYHKTLHEKIDPIVISLDPFGGRVFLVKTHAGQINQAITDTEAIWSKKYPNDPFSYVFLDEEFDRLYKDDLRAITFSMVFGGLSILIACLGLLGMVMSTTQLRIKEIGIREVLGASVAGIVAMLSKDFLLLVCLAIVIASPLAWWAMNNWLADFAYRIEIQWWIFAAAGLTAVVIALITVSWQAVRAAIANPVDSLRDE